MFIERVTTNQGIQTNTIIAVIEDITNYYIVSGEGLDVITKATKSRSAWITRTGGYTCVAQDNNYIYLGTSDEGVYYILKLNLSGNSVAYVISFLDSSDPYGILIDSNNVVDISTDDGNFLIATDTGINIYDGSDVFSRTLSNIVYCRIVGTKLYYSVANNGIYYKSSLPVANDWVEDTVYSTDPYSDVIILDDDITDFVVLEGASTVNGSSNKIVAGSASGVVIIDTDESVAYSNGVVTILDGTDLADSINNITDLELEGTEVYAKGESTSKISISLIDTTVNTVTEKSSFIDCIEETVTWLSDWGARRKVTIDYTKVDSNLSEFPVALILSTTAGLGTTDLTSIFTEIDSDANRLKIAITTDDGITQLPVEVAWWDTTNKQALLYTKVPVVQSGIATSIYLYYDRSQVDNVYVGDTAKGNSINVWTGFLGVWHLMQIPDTGTYRQNNVLDSSGNHNHGSADRGTCTLEDSKIIKGIKFSGNTRLNFMNNPDFILGDMTIEIVFNKTSSAEILTVGYGGDGESLVTNYNFHLTLKPDGDISLLHEYGSGTNQDPQTTTGGYISTSTWYYVAAVRDITANDVEYQRNASVIETISYTTDFAGDGSSCYLMMGESASDSLDFVGIIDEVRITDQKLSFAWRKATYHSLFDTLVTYDSEETI